MTEGNQPSVESRSALKTKYLDHIRPQYLNTQNIAEEFSKKTAEELSKTIAEEFNNCSVFRILLYILREQLLKFIEEKFKEFITEHSLSDIDKSNIIEKIKEKVRSPPAVSADKSLKTKAKERLKKIKKLKENQITATDWRTIAKCYTGSFRIGKKEQFDPKDLLEILMYCSLFPDTLYPAALAVIDFRNIYYGHISALVIDSDTLVASKSSIYSLLELIPAQDAGHKD